MQGESSQEGKVSLKPNISTTIVPILFLVFNPSNHNYHGTDSCHVQSYG
jgi:hypothetical protein